jgi:hypothetical protein
MPHKDLLNRAELLRFLTAEGFPLGKSTFNRMCAPGAGNNGPPVESEAGQGRLHLYSRARALKWAQENLVLVPRLVLRSGGTSRRKQNPLRTAA